MEELESSGSLYRRIGLWTANILADLVIAFIFVTMVMSATAQQEALSQLKSQQVSLGYRAAFAISEQAREIERKNRSDLAKERSEVAALRLYEQRYRETERQFENAWAVILPSAGRLVQLNMCDIVLPADNSLAARENVLDSIRDCSADEGTSPRAARILNSAKKEEHRARDALDSLLTAFENYYPVKLALEATQTDVKNATQLTADQEKIRKSFSEIDFMLDSRALLGWVFVPLPPAILQIGLTFVAGLFGALLVTLILIVYPDNKLNIQQKGRTWARTFLGGLIALCVYIVLLSGTAVLGSSNINSGAGTNYLAFCGIGILAGMFSDRVAAWLSDRAGMFFRQSGGPANSAGGAGGGTGSGSGGTGGGPAGGGGSDSTGGSGGRGTTG